MSNKYNEKDMVIIFYAAERWVIGCKPTADGIMHYHL